MIHHARLSKQISTVVKHVCILDKTLDVRNPMLQQLVLEVLVSMAVTREEIATTQSIPQREKGWYLARAGIFDHAERIYVPPLITGSACGPLVGLNPKYKPSRDQILDMIWPEFSKCENAREQILADFVQTWRHESTRADYVRAGAEPLTPPPSANMSPIQCAPLSVLQHDAASLGSMRTVLERLNQKYDLANLPSHEGMDRGTASEPLVMALTFASLKHEYGCDYDVGMTQTGLTLSLERPWIAASPDGLIYVRHLPTGLCWLRGLEMKVRGKLGTKPIGPIPGYYWAQVQSAMQIMRHEHDYHMQDYLFVSYTPDEMHMTSFEYDTEEWAQIFQPKLDAIYFETIMPLFVLKILNRLQVGTLQVSHQFPQPTLSDYNPDDHEAQWDADQSMLEQDAMQVWGVDDDHESHLLQHGNEPWTMTTVNPVTPAIPSCDTTTVVVDTDDLVSLCEPSAIAPHDHAYRNATQLLSEYYERQKTVPPPRMDTTHADAFADTVDTRANPNAATIPMAAPDVFGWLWCNWSHEATLPMRYP